jgi:hypothetical protein
MGRNMLIGRLNLPADHPMAVAMRGRLRLVLEPMEARLAGATWVAGNEFTAADIMTVFSLTTMRNFNPVDLSPYPKILAYLQRVAARPAYQVAMARGDPGMPLLLTGAGSPRGCAWPTSGWMQAVPRRPAHWHDPRARASPPTTPDRGGATLAPA